MTRLHIIKPIIVEVVGSGLGTHVDPCKGCVHSVYPKAILDVQYKANRGRVKMKGRVLDHQPTTQNNVDTYLHVQTLFIYLFIFKIIYYFGDLSLP